MKNFFDIDMTNAYPVVTPQRMAEAYLNRLYRKMHVDGFSLLLIFYGKHRTGKSLTAVSFCYLLDPTFEENLEKRVVYNSRQLIQAFKEIREKKIIGAGIIVDEAGTGDLSSQRWFEEMAKVVMANLQAVGYLKPFLCFVTQNFSFINSVARKLSQGVYEVDRIENLYSTVKPYWIESNPFMSSGSFYRKYPIFCENRNGIASNIFKLSLIKIELPPLPIRQRYIAHSQAYKDKLLKDSEEEIDSLEAEKTRTKVVVNRINELADEVYEHKEDYTRISRKGDGVELIDENLIRHKYGLSILDAKVIRALVEKRLKASGISKSVDMNEDALSDIQASAE